MKNFIKKAVIVCSIIVLTGNTVSMAAVENAAGYEEKEHSGKTWDEMKEIDYDYDAIAGHIARMEELAAEEGNKADKGQEVLELYQQFMADIELLDTCYSVAHILYYCDVQNEELAEREEQVYLEYVDLSDRMCSAMDAILKSPYQEILQTVMTKEEQEEFLDYEKMTDREKQLVEEESGLVQEYDKVSSQKFSVVIDGKEWNYENMMSDVESYEAFVEVNHELGRVKNEALSGIYQKLIEIRVEMADIYGYDNYLDYAMEEAYERDYSAEDVEFLLEEIKTYAVPAYIELEQLYYMMDWEPIAGMDTEPEKILDTIEPYMAEIDQEMYQTFTYMRKYGLLDIGESSQKGEGGFTTGLPLFGEAFIFNNPGGDYHDYATMIHEFGHFYNDFSNQEPVMYDNSCLDVIEIHSQGLQMLFCEYSGDMFGAEIGQAFNLLQVLDMLQSGMVYQSMISEFEMEVYRNPDMSIQEINRLYAELEREYRMGYETEYEEAYSWVDIPHIYRAPLYCISYVTSGLSALDLFAMAQADREEAVACYMELVALPSNVGYGEAIEQCGLYDIFESGRVKDILTSTMILLQETEAIDKAEPNRESMLYVALVMAGVFAIQSLVGVVTGIIVLCRRR